MIVILDQLGALLLDALRATSYAIEDFGWFLREAAAFELRQ